MSKDKVSAKKEIIEKNFCNLKIDEIDFFGEGFDNEVYLVNKEYIFRFPQRNVSAKEIEKEIAILSRLKDSVNVKIPEFSFIGEDKGIKFVGYKKIDGTPLTKDRLSKISETAKRKLIKEIAEFLIQIHSFPQKEALSLGIEKSDFDNIYSHIFRWTEKNIFPRINKRYQDKISKIIEEKGNSKNKESVVLHNDMKHDHILINEKTEKLEGVIDFGDITIGNPRHDLMFLFKDFGKDFIDILLEYYPANKLRSDELIPELRYFQIGNILRSLHDQDKQEISENDLLLIEKSLQEI